MAKVQVQVQVQQADMEKDRSGRQVPSLALTRYDSGTVLQVTGPSQHSSCATGKVRYDSAQVQPECVVVCVCVVCCMCEIVCLYLRDSVPVFAR